jgi:prophage antirepressor-like protein
LKREDIVNSPQASVPEVFQFNTQEIRVILKDDGPWFIAGEIAKALEYQDGPHLARLLDEDERGSFYFARGTSGGNPNMTIINESGLYHAIFLSRKPKAKEFRRWVTGEVLPMIRKTGRYDPDEFLKLTADLAQTKTELENVSRALSTWQDDSRGDREFKCYDQGWREAIQMMKGLSRAARGGLTTWENHVRSCERHGRCLDPWMYHHNIGPVWDLINLHSQSDWLQRGEWRTRDNPFYRARYNSIGNVPT